MGRGHEEASYRDQEFVNARKAAGYTSLGGDEVRRFLRRYRSIVRAGCIDNPEPVPVPGKRGRPKDTKAGNLVRRLMHYRREVLAFMYDFSVPFSNNLAERDIRMTKVQQKVSGPFRSCHGGPSFCRIRSYLSTARKQGLSPFDALVAAVAGHPFIPNQAC